MFETIVTYLPYVAPGLLLLFVAFGAIGGLAKCLFREILHFAKVLGAAILAFPATVILTDLFSTKGVDALLPLVENAGIDLSQSPNLQEAVVDLLRCVVAVEIYATCFIVLLMVLGIVVLILNPIFKGIENGTFKKNGVSKFLGALIGIVTGALACVVFFMPLFGLGHTVYSATEILLNESESKYVEENKEMIEQANVVSDGLVNNTVEDLVWGMGQKGLYRGVTTVKTEYGKAVLDDEIQATVRILNDVLILAETDVQSYDQKQVDAINHIVAEIKDKTLLPELLAAFLHDASNAWANGNAFFGIEAPGKGTDYEPILDSVYLMFSKTDANTIGDDLQVFADMIGTLQKYEVLASLNNTEDLLATLTQPGVLTELLDTLSSNENTAVLIDGLVDVAMDMVAEQLGIPADDAAVMDEILNDSADSWNEVLTIEDEAERTEVLAEKLTDVFDSYNVEMSEGMIDAVAGIMVENFSDIGEIDTENMSEFLLAVASSYAAHMGTSEPENNTASTGLPIADFLGYLENVVPDIDKEIDKYFDIIFQEGEDGAKIQLQLREAGFSDNLAVHSVNLITEVANNAVCMDTTLGNAETFKANVVTAESLKGVIADTLLAKNEDGISNLEAIASVAVDIMNSGEADTTAIMAAVSQVASNIDGASIREMIKLAISADNLGIDAKIKTSIQKSLNSLTDADLEVLAGKLEVISHLNDYVSSLQGTKDSEVVMATILETLDPATAKVLAKMVNRELLVAFGVKSEQAGDYAAFLTTMFENYDESDANVKAMNLVVTIGLNQTTSKPMFGEDSISGISAEEMVSIMLNSSMAKAGLKCAGVDALGIASIISDADKAAVDAALSAGNYASEDANAIRNLLGMN